MIDIQDLKLILQKVDLVTLKFKTPSPTRLVNFISVFKAIFESRY